MAKHPAVFSDEFIPIFAKLLQEHTKVLDPFAGTGKIAAIKEYGFKGTVTCNEIEPEWANTELYPVDEWHVGDAAHMSWAEDESYDAICTSPTYGNRMADHHNARDTSKRITYRHVLGRELNVENTGRMQWGPLYRNKHVEIYVECLRLLKRGGIIILNVSNHIRKGVLISVADWHKDVLTTLKMEFIGRIEIKTKRMRFGSNSRLRPYVEYILIFRKETL